MYQRLSALIFLFPVLVPGLALAQADTPASLRQQITQLTREIDSLRAELETLREKHRALLVENESLRRRLAGREQPPPRTLIGSPSRTPGPERPALTTPLLREPLSSPEALFIALTLDYQEQMGELEFTDRESEADASRRVRAWTRDIPSRFSGQSQWLTRLRLLDARPAENGRDAVITILDPATLSPICAPFSVHVPARFVARMENHIGASEGGGESDPSGTLLWKLRVQLDALPVHQPERLTPGPFDYPRLIGPFAAFGFSTRIIGIGPVPLAEAMRATVGDHPDMPPADR